MRLRILLLVFAASLAAPGLAHATQTLQRPSHSLYRPNPVFTGIQLEYIKPLPTPTGSPATLVPLSEAAVKASVLDMERLAYRIRDDLGGFTPAPLGELALSSGGHEVIGATNGRAQIPLYEHHAGGKVNAFTFIGGGPGINPGNTDNGKSPLPGLNGNVPVPVPPASNNTKVPPANGGFAGQGTTGAGKNGTGTAGTGPNRGNGGGGAGTGRTTTSKGGTGRGRTGSNHTTTARTTTARTTTARTTTVSSTTTQATITTGPTTTTTTGGGGGGGGGGGSDCGTNSQGITVAPGPSNPHGSCIMRLTGAKPGDSESEVLTLTNVSDATFTLALKVTDGAPLAGGGHSNLWNDLEMAVWIDGTPTPSPLPPLLFWTTQFNNLTRLNPGKSITYDIELFLPVEAGNIDQTLGAVINFKWQGH